MIPVLSSNYRYSRSQVSSLATTIAYAVKHGIPIENALNSLLPSASTLFFFSFMRSPFVGGFLYPFFKTRAFYYHAIRKTIMELHKGTSLPECLDRHLGDILPPHYRAGVRMAFDSGKQEGLLMKLAETTCREFDLPNTTNYFPILFTYLGIFLTVVSGLLYFIMPKFRKMASEMGQGEPTWPFFDIISSPLFINFMHYLFWTICLIVFLLFAYRTITFVFRFPKDNVLARTATGLINDITSFIPFFGRFARDRLRLEALQRIYGGLIAEMPLIDAVTHAAYAMEDCILCRQLRRLSLELQAGKSVQEAFNETKAWDPFTRWVLISGLNRDELAQACALQIRFLRETCNRGYRFWNKAFAIGFVLFMGVLTSLATIGFFEPLTYLIDHLADQVM